MNDTRDDKTISDDELIDILDELARTFVKVADELWEKGRNDRRADKISREQYAGIRANSRALVRRSVEIVTSASILRLQEVRGAVEGLSKITDELKAAKKKIDRAQNITEAVINALTAVTWVVAAVYAPTPQTIGNAINSAKAFAAAVAASVD